MVRAAAIPGGGAIARATDIALVYQHLVHNNGGALPAAWLTDAISTIRNGSINTSDGTPANRTITGCIAGDDGYAAHRWFPDRPNAFGHHGAGGQLCWVDPASGVSFCFLHDTLQLDPRADFLRARALNSLVTAAITP
jgi:CubicO group peptidase (beta-lactamase class C family)